MLGMWRAVDVRSLAPLVLSLALGACSASGELTEIADGLPRPEDRFQTVTFDGRPLFRPVLDDERGAELEDDLEEARARWRKHPEDEDAIVWYGRRLAYLGRYQEAVGVYTEGLALHPKSPRLLRHRGHRYVTLRRPLRAIEDLLEARRLTAGKPDVVEEDGAPNAAGVPRSTLQSNIGYHLGLAWFLLGDFEQAADAYRRCLEVSRVNDDMLCATTHWLYMSLRRLGRDDEARAVLEPIHADMEILENDAYHELLLMYAGERTPEDVLGPAGDGADTLPGLQFATRGFGVGHWYLVEGRTEEALALFERVVEGTAWPAFGHIAAEAELARR